MSELAVVTVCTPEGIYRAITSCWTGPRKMIEELVRTIGLCHLKDTEWTAAIYRTPRYVKTDLMDEPHGVYFYAWRNPFLGDPGGTRRHPTAEAIAAIERCAFKDPDHPHSMVDEDES